jgi:CHASE2 domain-containing sensor protein
MWLKPLRSRIVAAFEELGHKSLRHWITAGLVLTTCYFAGPYIDEYLGLKRVEYWTFQTLAQFSSGKLEPKKVTLVVVGDEEYWLGSPAGRSPTNREYLASMLKSLGASRASTLALDFDLRSPDPSSPVIQASYRQETQNLVSEIVRQAALHKIVLAKAIWVDERTGDYVLDPDVYQAYGICTAFDKNGNWQNPGTPKFPIGPIAASNISCGYVALPYDMRLVPGQIEVGAHRVDSFALAIARSVSPAEARDASGMNFGSYMGMTLWKNANSIFDPVQATKFLAASPGAFDNRIIIIGAGWSSLARDRGDPVDIHRTPVGMLSGSMIHGNFVEAILGHRTFHATAEWLPEACELTFGVLAALVFSLEHTALTKIIALLAVSCAFLLLQWLLLLTVGVLFEALVPVFGLWIHSVIERLIGETE